MNELQKTIISVEHCRGEYFVTVKQSADMPQYIANLTEHYIRCLEVAVENHDDKLIVLDEDYSL